MNGDSFANCDSFTNLDVDQPGDLPNAHFTYTFGGVGADAYTLSATRNTRDGGATSSNIKIQQTINSVIRSGATAFANVK